MRIDVNGALPDGAGGIPVSGLPVPYAMAFGGGRSLVVGDVSTLVAATLDTSAAPTAGPTVAVALAANVQSIPAAAYDGSGYLVTWFDLRVTNGVMMGARLDENGLTRDPNAITVYNGSAISYPVHVPVMASNGTDFIVAWRGGSGPTMSSGSNVMARAVTAAGDVPGSATAIAVSDAYAPTDISDRVRRDGVLRLLERDRPGTRACRHSRGASRHGRCFSGR